MSRNTDSRRNSAVVSNTCNQRGPLRDERLEEFLPDAARSSVRATRMRPYLAEDAKQEALIAVCKALDSYDPRRQVPMVNYMRRIIARACWKTDRDEARHWSEFDRNVDVHDPDMDGELGHFSSDLVDSTLSEAIRVDQQEAIEAVVVDLRYPQRRLFELLYVDGLTQREAAFELGVSQQRVQQINRSVIDAIRRVVCN